MLPKRLAILTAATLAALAAAAWGLRPSARDAAPEGETTAGLAHAPSLEVDRGPALEGRDRALRPEARVARDDAGRRAGMEPGPGPERLPPEPAPEDIDRERAKRTEADVVEGVVLGADAREGWKVGLWLLPQFGGSLSQSDPGWHAEWPVRSDGRFAFHDVALVTYELRVEGPGGVARRSTVTRAPDSDGQDRQVVVVGTARLGGRVYDVNGDPAAGCRVELTSEPWQSLGARRDLALTDAAGAYVFAGLRSGEFRMWTEAGQRPDGDMTSGGIRLARGEARTFDFGVPTEGHSWSGVARLATGAAIRPPASVYIESVEDSIFQRRSFLTGIGPDGRFSRRLPAGTYEARLWLRTQSGRDLLATGHRMRFTLEDSDLHRDFVAPGVRVTGVLRNADTGQPFQSWPNNVARVRLWPAEEPEPRPEPAVADVNPDGTFSMDGVPAGRMRLQAVPPIRVLMTGTSVELTVGESDVSGVTLELRGR